TANVLDTNGPVRVSSPANIRIEYHYFSDANEHVVVANPLGGWPFRLDRTVQFADDSGRALTGLDDAPGDHLYGCPGAGTLTGNKGAGYLAGGRGFDQYLYAAGDGVDTIFDVDGQGSIVYDGITLGGGAQVNQGDHVWRSDDGKVVFTLTPSSANSNTLTIAG